MCKCYFTKESKSNFFLGGGGGGGEGRRGELSK